MVFEGDKILLPLTIAGDAAYDIEFLGSMAQIKQALVLGADKTSMPNPSSRPLNTCSAASIATHKQPPTDRSTCCLMPSRQIYSWA